MNNQTVDRNSLLRLCNGNVEAVEWLQLGRIYCHEIDDLIDEDVPAAARARAAERACRIGAMALRLYSHPFFQKNIQALGYAMMINTINYADSVAWEDSKTDWQKSYSDWARHGWLDVALVVASICGGYDVARNESRELRAVAYADHHSKTGNAT